MVHGFAPRYALPRRPLLLRKILLSFVLLMVLVVGGAAVFVASRQHLQHYLLISQRRLTGGFRFGLRSTAAGSVLDRSSLGGLARRRTPPSLALRELPLGGSMVLAALDHPDRLADDIRMIHLEYNVAADKASKLKNSWSTRSRST